jgi:hypothetical protein
MCTQNEVNTLPFTVGNVGCKANKKQSKDEQTHENSNAEEMYEIKVKGKGVPIHVTKSYGEWEFSSAYSKPWPYSDVGCDIHPLVTLLRRKVNGYVFD